MIQILGWIGNFGFFGGVILLGRKNILGWYMNILGNGMYLWQAYVMNNMPLVWLSLGLVILNINGIRQWSKKNVKSNCRCCKNKCS